ncbi:MAG: DUF1203 domain-containing protein [Rhodobacter sp.]|uniref:DUF1203 domain-containing protein n=1 Tax=Pararhodobacter sp. TaxID=2127056 RepID=UPI002C32A501|nr:DUF1203 domain-containing protein [Pararhodobacter sp.]MCC0072890.1 DUF1203 domain-containing protein [Rhodobacter sp.]HPD91973.1 DUF1203 domain-containing protein [Pararhodobacter sp.]
MRPIFLPLPDATAAHYRSGGPDAYGLRPERRVADGGAIPCRHSLRLLPAGTPYLIVAHRPFAGLNPYAETGPIFLAAEDTPGAAPTTELPPFLTAAAYIVRGYSLDERIVYGTGAVTPTDRIVAACANLLACDAIAFVHVRSATNNCFHVRVQRDHPAEGFALGREASSLQPSGDPVGGAAPHTPRDISGTKIG